MTRDIAPRRLRPPAALPALAFLATLLLLAAGSPAATLVLTGPEGAEVSLDGHDLGTFPLAGPLELRPGLHVVRSELRGYQDYEAELLLNDEDERLLLHVRPNPLKRRVALISSLLIAGSGQRYVGRRTFGWVLTGAEVGGLLTALLGEVAVQDNRDEYLLLRDGYENALNESEMERYRRGAEAALADAEDAERRRDVGLLVAGAAVALSALDAWIRFPGVAGAGEVPVGTDLASAGLAFPAPAALAGPTAFHAGLQLRF